MASVARFLADRRAGALDIDALDTLIAQLGDEAAAAERAVAADAQTMPNTLLAALRAAALPDVSALGTT
jgi:hypothetical protein